MSLAPQARLSKQHKPHPFHHQSQAAFGLLSLISSSEIAYNALKTLIVRFMLTSIARYKEKISSQEELLSFWIISIVQVQALATTTGHLST